MSNQLDQVQRPCPCCGKLQYGLRVHEQNPDTEVFWHADGSSDDCCAPRDSTPERSACPGMPELMYASVTEACSARWAWGRHFPVGSRLEDDGCERVAVYEAYEEALDLCNYLDFALHTRSTRHLRTLHAHAVELATGLREACIEESKWEPA